MHAKLPKNFLVYVSGFFVLLYVAALVLIQHKTNFYVALIDFDGNTWLAAAWDWSDPASWANSIHPIGYTVLLHEVCRPTIEDRAIQQCASDINCAFSAIGLVAAWVLTRYRTGPDVWALVAIVALSVSPYLEVSLLQSADMGCAAFATIGLALLHRSGRPGGSGWAALLAGVALGLAALWRYYGFALAIGVVLGQICWAVRDPAERRRLPLLLVGFWALYALQLGADLDLDAFAAAISPARSARPRTSISSSIPDPIGGRPWASS